ncbi:MAG: hypothetical protein ACFFA3_19465 [Promethearchaeota archaeon]
MLETYNDFMIFKVKDNGEEFRVNASEELFRQNNGNEILDPLQVVIIIKEALRRIYIWKGVSSSVRKKFIASRIASDMQRKLTESSNFHRCKIISVDQGDEPEEFLNAFGFKKTLIPHSKLNSDDLTKMNNTFEICSNAKMLQEKDKNVSKRTLKPNYSPSYSDLKKNKNFRNVLERVLKEKIPDNFRRINILIGNNTLYGLITKKTEIFNDFVEIKEWDQISNLSNQIIELEGQKLRIYLNRERKIVEAIEILEKIPSYFETMEDGKQEDYNKWTVKQLKQFCHENNIKILSSYRKADIVQAVTNYNSSCSN